MACTTGGGPGSVIGNMLVKQLGRLPWKQALASQIWHVRHFQDNTLLLCEHTPVYTAGRRSSFTVEEEEELRRLGADVHKTGRGGQITFHGPGQLMGYLIFDVRQVGGVRCHVHKIEQSIIRACSSWNLEASTSPHTGVWLGDNKVAAIGVQVSRGISYHGFALNCNVDLSWFSHIVPCGITDKGVTSLSQAIGREVTIAEATPHIVGALETTFGFKAVQAQSDSSK